ncbi:hypothetical protein [Polaromonas sp. DSP2-3-2b2]|uniref:hypothetical protein n=1 Tax=Polaromonas sp. DSP2-3-2b2 TaxID=2804662 RepID=UPI003CF76E96
MRQQPTRRQIGVERTQPKSPGRRPVQRVRLIFTIELLPLKLRGFTLLPRLAPTVSPRLFAASAISGSGLFQAEPEWMPTSGHCGHSAITGVPTKAGVAALLA